MPDSALFYIITFILSLYVGRISHSKDHRMGITGFDMPPQPSISEHFVTSPMREALNCFIPIRIIERWTTRDFRKAAMIEWKDADGFKQVDYVYCEHLEVRIRAIKHEIPDFYPGGKFNASGVITNAHVTGPAPRPPSVSLVPKMFFPDVPNVVTPIRVIDEYKMIIEAVDVGVIRRINIIPQKIKY